MATVDSLREETDKIYLLMEILDTVDHQFLELVTFNVDVKDEVVDPLYDRFKHAHNDIIDIFGDFIAIHFKAAKNTTIDSTDAVDEE